MASCEDCLDLISAAIDGAISPAEENMLREHLSHCPKCQALQKELTTLHHTFQELPPPEAPENLTERIMTAVAKENITPFSPKKKSFVLSTRVQGWLVSAAIFAFALALQQHYRPFITAGQAATPDDSPVIASAKGSNSTLPAEDGAEDTEFSVAAQTFPEFSDSTVADSNSATYQHSINTEEVSEPEFRSAASPAGARAVDISSPLTVEDAFTLVAEFCQDSSEYTLQVQEESETPPAVQFALLDEERTVSNLTVTFTGEDDNCYYFSCQWETSPETFVFYSVHKTEKVVSPLENGTVAPLS